MGSSKSGGSDRKEARAVDYVKTSQEAEATLDRRAAEAKAKKASRRTEAPETDDSPKRRARPAQTPPIIRPRRGRYRRGVVSMS